MRTITTDLDVHSGELPRRVRTLTHHRTEREALIKAIDRVVFQMPNRWEVTGQVRIWSSDDSCDGFVFCRQSGGNALVIEARGDKLFDAAMRIRRERPLAMIEVVSLAREDLL